MNEFRSRLFMFVAAAVFFVASPLVVMYARGTRISLDEPRFYATGGVFLATQPKQAAVYLDGKLAGRTNRLIDGLKPGPVIVRIERDGLLRWTKTLVIQPYMVTEATDVVLWPVHPALESVSHAQVLAGRLERQSVASSTLPIILSNGETFFVKDSALMVADEEGLRQLSSEVSQIALAPDEHKLLFVTPDGLWVYWLQGHVRPYRVDEGHMELVFPAKGKIARVWWYKNSAQIGAVIDGRLVLIELDGRDARNAFTFFDSLDDATIHETVIYVNQQDVWWQTNL